MISVLGRIKTAMRFKASLGYIVYSGFNFQSTLVYRAKGKQ